LFWAGTDADDDAVEVTVAFFLGGDDDVRLLLWGLANFVVCCWRDAKEEPEFGFEADVEDDDGNAEEERFLDEEERVLDARFFFPESLSRMSTTGNHAHNTKHDHNMITICSQHDHDTIIK
jgi:hypothetical protein